MPLVYEFIPFSRHNHALPQTKGIEFQSLSYLSTVLRTERGVFILFYCTKVINFLALYRNIKSQDHFGVSVKVRDFLSL